MKGDKVKGKFKIESTKAYLLVYAGIDAVW